MRPTNIPAIGPRYWAALSAASVFGANSGDFASHVLHLGHVRGLPLLALAFAGLLRAERRSGVRTEAWYWAAIVVLRTAATNLADLATHDLALPYAGTAGVLGTLLVLLLLQPASGRGRGGPVSADGWYWAAMLAAGTLGTVIGDGVADGLGMGPGPASILLAAVLAAVLAVAGRSGWAAAAGYWGSVVAVRSAGTAAGDALAGAGGIGLGLPLSTACTGAGLAAILLLWRARTGGSAGAHAAGSRYSG